MTLIVGITPPTSHNILTSCCFEDCPNNWLGFLLLHILGHWLCPGGMGDCVDWGVGGLFGVDVDTEDREPASSSCILEGYLAFSFSRIFKPYFCIFRQKCISHICRQERIERGPEPAAAAGAGPQCRRRRRVHNVEIQQSSHSWPQACSFFFCCRGERALAAGRLLQEIKFSVQVKRKAFTTFLQRMENIVTWVTSSTASIHSKGEFMNYSVESLQGMWTSKRHQRCM